MKRFADRGFILINGVEVLHLVSATVTTNNNLQRMSTMTRNKRDAGYTSGNKSITIDLEMAIEKNRAQIDLALANEDSDVALVFECGGERLTVNGVAESSKTISSGVGTASKSMSLEALDIVNENGESVNTDIQL